MADIFESELDAAGELAKKKFLRGAGAMAGVVLEKHLRQVCSDHSVKILKKASTISYLNDRLKEADVVDVQKWRLYSILVTSEINATTTRRNQRLRRSTISSPEWPRR